MKAGLGLYVTSNASLSHIEVGETRKTFCGIVMGDTHPNSETRWYAQAEEFKEFVEENRSMPDDGYRFCKKCLKIFDKWYNSQVSKPENK